MGRPRSITFQNLTDGSGGRRLVQGLTKDDKYRGSAAPLAVGHSAGVRRVGRPAVSICPDTVEVVNTTADSRFVIYSFESTSPDGAVLISLTFL